MKLASERTGAAVGAGGGGEDAGAALTFLPGLGNLWI